MDIKLWMATVMYKPTQDGQCEKLVRVWMAKLEIWNF